MPIEMSPRVSVRIRDFGVDSFLLSICRFVVCRLITNTKKYDHITPAQYSLHWLPVFYRNHFKILIIIFKAIYNISPSYICNLVSIKSCSDYSLGSNKSLFLDRPKGCMLSTLGLVHFMLPPPHYGIAFPCISGK